MHMPRLKLSEFQFYYRTRGACTSSLTLKRGERRTCEKNLFSRLWIRLFDRNGQLYWEKSKVSEIYFGLKDINWEHVKLFFTVTEANTIS